MKTVAYFPVKLNNERTPGKNIKPFSNGKPLMNFVQCALLELKKKILWTRYIVSVVMRQ